MKKLKKLSLKKEIEREAEALEKEVSGRKDLDHITVSEDMEEALFQKIQDYEYEKRAKVVYRKKKKRYAIIAVAAVFILVFGSVMTGVGSKSYWKVWWDREVDEGKISYIDVDKMSSQETEDIDEVQAYKEIRSELGILPVRLVYSPEGMEIEKYELNTDLQKAMLLYKYKGQTVKYTMYMNNADSSFGEKKTDELVDEFLIISDNGVEIKVKEYEEKDKKVRRYEAEFEYAGAQYEIKGVVEKKEFEKILKNLYFSKVKRVSFFLFGCLLNREAKKRVKTQRGMRKEKSYEETYFIYIRKRCSVMRNRCRVCDKCQRIRKRVRTN